VALPYVFPEALGEHGVRLVNNDMADVPHRHIPLLNMLHQSSRRADQNVEFTTQLKQLRIMHVRCAGLSMGREDSPVSSEHCATRHPQWHRTTL
jgi:hypothetical protein